MTGTLKCSTCKEHKPPEEFCAHKSKTARGGKSYQCKQCTKKRWTRWSQRTGYKSTHNHKRWRYEKQYGVSYERYLQMLEEQGGQCAICLGNFASEKDTHLDHCHATGLARGVLCSRCNTAIGLMKDDAARLRRAATYLEIER